MRATERKSTTPLLFLRAFQLGMTMEDIKELSVGEIFDVLTENANDSYEYAQIADQSDFNAFAGI